MKAAGSTRDDSRAFRGWLIAFVLVAVGARILRWAVGAALTGDEAYLALNIAEMGFADIFGPLSYNQVAPGGFLLAEIGIYQWLGSGERGLRLVALLAGLASLFCFWRLCLVVLRGVPARRGLAALFAFALLGVSAYVIRYGAQVKPYSVDAFAASLLLWLGSEVVAAREPRAAKRALVALAIVVAPVVWFSYPSVFVATAVALVLLIPVRRGRVPVGPFVAYSVLLCVGFLSAYLLVAQPQLEGSARGGEFLRSYWARAFPPGEPLAFLAWFGKIHTGHMFAHPSGGQSPGSIATFLLFLIGAVVLWRRSASSNGRLLLALLLLPFALALGAAVLRLYPYGAHARLALHLAPSICLLAGLGLASLVSSVPSETGRRHLTRAGLTVLLLFGLLVMARNAYEPNRPAVWGETRELVRTVSERAGPDGRVYSVQSPHDLRRFFGGGATYRWYLQETFDARLEWPGAERASRPQGRVVLVSYTKRGQVDAEAAIRAWLAGPGVRLGLPVPKRETFRYDEDAELTVLEFDR